MSQPKDIFADKMRALLGDETENFFKALESPPQKAVTINMSRLGRNAIEEVLDFPISPIPKVENGYYIDRDLSIGKTIAHHLGIVYSQEPSAMYPVEMLDITPGDIVLDLCSAPGGKSIQILEKLKGQGLLVANEIVYSRAKILYENLNRMGFDNFVITCNAPSDFEKTSLKFDKILVDAPCGGEGMFRRKNFDFNSYNNASIETNSKRQSSILNSIKRCLRKGGKLVYSTCTYDIEENERVVANFLKENADFQIQNYPRLQDVTTQGFEVNGEDTQFSLRRYPHKFAGEGQFMALMQKDGEEDISTCDEVIADGFKGIYRKELDQLKRVVGAYANINNTNLVKKNESIFLVPDTLVNLRGLNVLSIGTLLGNLNNNGFKPSHTAFHSQPQIFENSIELSREDTLKYLQGLEIDTDSNVVGIVVVTYKGIALGGGKIVNERLKNYYPRELRN